MKKFIKQYWLIILVFLVGTILRVWGISNIPAFLDWDEKAIGYNAFSIAQIGKDEWGFSFPLLFRSFGDYKLPLYIYLTSIFVKFFGLNIITVKLVAVICGILSLILIYFISKLIFQKETPSIIATIFFALSPYGIFYSHLSQETVLASFLILLSIFMEMLFVRKKNILYWCLSLLILGISIYSYSSARIISPIFIVIFSALNFLLIKISKKKLFIVFLSFLSSLLIISIQLKSGGFSRFKESGIFGENKSGVMTINEFRYQDKNNLISKIFHNKPLYFTVNLTRNYLTHFSPDFLVGFRNLDVVQESFYPPLFLIMLPFYYFGLLSLFSNWKKLSKENKIIQSILFAWIFISPLPSAITEGAPSSKRSLLGLGTMEIVVTYYLINLLNRYPDYKKKIFYVFFCLYFINVIFFLNFFYKIFPESSKPVYGINENSISLFIKKNYSQFDYFIYSGSSSNQHQIFPLFDLTYQPDKYVVEKKWYREKEGWYWIESFDKFIFYDRINKKVWNSIITQISNKKIGIFLSESELQDISDLLPKNIKPNFISLYPYNLLKTDKRIFFIHLNL